MKLNSSELEALRNASDPAQVLQEFFENSENASDIPLDDFCEMGGAPDPEDAPEIAVQDAVLRDGGCSGVLTAFFNEVVYGGGCPDMPTVKPRQGDVVFDVDLLTGEVSIDGNEQ